MDLKSSVSNARAILLDLDLGVVDDGGGGGLGEGVEGDVAASSELGFVESL